MSNSEAEGKLGNHTSFRASSRDILDSIYTERPDHWSHYYPVQFYSSPGGGGNFPKYRFLHKDDVQRGMSDVLG